MINSNENVEFQLHQNSKLGVPPHLKNSTLGVKLNKTDQYVLISSKLTETHKNNTVEFYNIENRTFKISLTKHNNDMVDVYRFTPVFSIKNCLPFQIDFQMLNENNVLIEKILNPQESFMLTNLDITVFQSLKLRIYGSQWSERKYLFDNCFMEKGYLLGDTATKRTKIELIDIKTKRIQIVNLLEIVPLELFLYCDAVIIDETEMDLLLYSINNTIKTIEAFLIPGQTNEPAESLIKPTAFLLNDQENIIIAKKGYLDDKTFPICVDQDMYTKQMINITKPEPFILEFGVKVKSIICGNSILQIYCKFTFRES